VSDSPKGRKTSYRSVRSCAALMAALAVCAVATRFFPSVANVEAATAGLIAAYDFDQGTGTMLTDVSGNGNHGVISGAVWTGTAKYGGALSFDGINDWVSIGDAPSLDLTTTMTLEAWVRPTALGGDWRTVILKERPNGLTYALYATDGASRPPAGYVASGNGDRGAVGPSVLPVNTWSHLAVTYNGSALRLFVNGVLVRSRSVSGAGVTSTGTLRLGGNAVWGEFFSGQLDDVRLYNRVLTASEIQADMNTPLSSEPDTTSPTVSVTAPAEGATVSGIVTVSADASDDIGVSGVQFFVNDVATGLEDTTAPYGLSWETRTTADGGYRISARARDAAGNTGNAATVNVTVNNTPPPDTTPPTISITAPASGATVSGTVLVSANASDGVGVAGVQFLIDDVAAGPEDTVAPYSFDWATPSGPDGPHRIGARARDAAGNTAYAEVAVTVANEPVPDFSFVVTPSSRTVPQSGSVAYDVDVVFQNGFTSSSVDLWVTGLPQGASGAFAFDPMPHQGRTSMTITTSAVTPGTYQFVAGATAEGISHSQNVTLVVSTAANFTLTSSPSIQNVVRGNATSYRMSASVTNGFNQAVTLSVSGLPAQTTATFSPNPLLPPGTSDLVVQTTSSTAPGQYALTVTGQGGGLTKTVSLTLIVSSVASTWSVETMGSTGVPNNTVRVGPIRTDGLNRVYVGTIATGRMLEYSWTGSDWSGPVDVGGSPAGSEIHNINIGTIGAAARPRIYAASMDRNIYEIWHAETGWQQRTVGTLDTAAMHTAVGDGRGDGVSRLYAVSTESVYEFTWSGTAWTGSRIGNTPGAHGITVGPGRGPGQMSLFIASISSGTFEGRYIGGAWTVSGMGDAGDVRDVDWGEGRNDGIVRVYSALIDGRIRELTWNGTSWTFAHLPGVGAPLIHAYVLPGRNDGINRVYSSSGNGRVYEYSWTGSGWTLFDMGGGPDYMYGLHFGDGRNDGRMRLYGADRGSVNTVYEYTWLEPPPSDTTPPSAPGGLTAEGRIGQAQLSWSAATDNIGVTVYNIHRSTDTGVVPTPANRVGQSASTSFTDNTAAGTYFYVVTALDAAGNVSAPSNEASATVLTDTTPPAVTLTAPAGGSTVSGVATLSADASDDVAVAGVQFLVNGNPAGAEDLQASYSTSWDTRTVPNGTYNISARARDAAGNTTTTAVVSVTVSNAVSTGLVGAYAFDEGTGTTALDSSGTGNGGTLSNAAWTTAGVFGSALSFNGSNAWVSIADSASLDLTTSMTLEAWVRPSSITSDWRTIILKERPSGLAYALYAADGASRPPAGYVSVNGTDAAAVAPTTLPLNTWTHVAMTYNGATLRLYVNGQLVGSRATTGSAPVSASPLRIGGNAVWGEWFSGSIDEVRIYNRALSQAEIQADMNTPIR
jgi:hypothetical protein